MAWWLGLLVRKGAELSLTLLLAYKTIISNMTCECPYQTGPFVSGGSLTVTIDSMEQWSALHKKVNKNNPFVVKTCSCLIYNNCRVKWWHSKNDPFCISDPNCSRPLSHTADFAPTQPLLHILILSFLIPYISIWVLFDQKQSVERPKTLCYTTALYHEH